MKKKLLRLSRWSFALALGVFAYSYFIYHYLASDGTITAVYQAAANKPVVTLLFAILGVLFLFTGVLSRLIVNDAAALLIIYLHEGCSHMDHCLLQKFAWCHNCI